MYVISVVMAAVPVKMSEKEIKEGVR
jgi:hypothetical protein